MENTSFRAIISDFKKPYITTKEFRELKEGEVLVKVLTATINPADRDLAFGKVEAPGIESLLPIGLGFEGSGVIEDGYGEQEKKLIGTPTAICFDPINPMEIGTWSEYVYMQAKDVMPFPEGTDSETICALGNPLTSFSMMERIEKGGHKAVVQSASCSALGKIFFRLCQKQGIPTINIVRKEEQIDIMKDIGAEHVLNSTSETFEGDLKELATRLQATIFFDPIGGDFILQVLRVLPANSSVVCLDNLSHKPISFDPLELIFQQKEISSLHSPAWMSNQSSERINEIFSEIANDISNATSSYSQDGQKAPGGIFTTKIYKSYPLEEIESAIEDSIQNAYKGKTIFKPHST
ncbi:unnamed protein product [Moneuplotes crassus]|uniref:Uncharacterized protein n=1 Tax=Euplotes crassus TaxID=5936 RepID=A0AAD1XIL1_EUPCR|nr:unnamed protein product [Moneuplotes crassus]